MKNLRARKSTLESKRTIEILNLGEFYYARKRGELVEEKLFEDRIENIKNIDQEIFNIKQLIVAKESNPKDLKCPDCGSRIFLGDSFCKVCGQDLNLLETVDKKVDIRECRVCKNTLSKTGAYCGACGYKQEEVEDVL